MGLLSRPEGRELAAGAKEAGGGLGFQVGRWQEEAGTLHL